MIGITIIALLFAILIGSLWVPFIKDPKRIKELIESIGGRDHEIINWTYLHPEYHTVAPGHWLVRTYYVRYRDGKGRVHFAHINTDLYNPLRIVNDKVVDAEKDQEIEYEFERKKSSWTNLLGLKK